MSADLPVQHAGSSDPAAWVKAHPRTAAGVAAAAVVGLALVTRSSGSSAGATDPADSAGGTTATDLYNDLQPEWEGVGQQVSSLAGQVDQQGDQLDALAGGIGGVSGQVTGVSGQVQAVSKQVAAVPKSVRHALNKKGHTKAPTPTRTHRPAGHTKTKAAPTAHHPKAKPKASAAVHPNAKKTPTQKAAKRISAHPAVQKATARVAAVTKKAAPKPSTRHAAAPAPAPAHHAAAPKPAPKPRGKRG